MHAVRDIHPPSETAEALIRAHYADFNARRLQDTAERFHTTARIENITGEATLGGNGFVLFAQQWLSRSPPTAFNCS